MRIYTSSRRKVFATDREGFRDRQACALQRRIGVGITAKVAAFAIGVHPDTVLNWAHGRSVMDGAAIVAAHAFFSASGDTGFLAEIFDRSAIAREPESRFTLADRCLWFTGEGVAHEAPEGHAQYVRDALKISAEPPDLSAYAIRNLGWVECLAQADGRVRLRYDAATADVAAIARLRDWLLSDGSRTTSVEIAAWRSKGWQFERPATISEAAQLLERASVAAHSGQYTKRNWKVERLPLESVTHPSIGKLTAAVQQGFHPVKVAAELGLFDTSSLFSIEGSNVISLWIGAALGLPTELFVNRNVLDRPDRQYSGLVYHHVLEAVNENSTFYRLDIEIMGRRRRYERVAISNGRNLVITSTQLLEETV